VSLPLFLADPTSLHPYPMPPPPPPSQVVSEVFCWTRNPVETRRLAARREEILAELLGGRKPLVPGGVTQLMDMLQRNQVCRVVRSSSRWRARLRGCDWLGVTSHL
jgi:hypothetical protein